MYKIGLSSCSKPISDELFENYQKAGIDAMEICLNALSHYRGYDYKSIYESAKKIQY